jgi:hypothetical protein
VKVIYPTGLLILLLVALLLGFWGWSGARMIGLWWLSIVVILLAAGFTFLAVRILVRMPTSYPSGQWTQIFRLERFYSFLNILFTLFRRIADVITGSLEGDGGLLWSFLLLVLILSILSTQGH